MVAQTAGRLPRRRVRPAARRRGAGRRGRRPCRGRAARDAARARRRGRAVGARARDAQRPRPPHGGGAGSRAARRSTAASSASRRCTVARWCSSPGRPIEAAPGTCPCGRRCGPSSIRSASRSSPSASMPPARRSAGRTSRRPQPEHPSLVDTTHRMAELFGVVNIPNGVWIDEHGTIVRPAEPANPHPPSDERPYRPMDGLPEHMNEIMDEASRIKVDGRYVDMLRDWAQHGADSPYALAPDEVVRALAATGPHGRRGQANLELGAALWARGDQRGAEAQVARGPPSRSGELHRQATGVVARRARRRGVRPVLAGSRARPRGRVALRERLVGRGPRVRGRALLPAAGGVTARPPATGSP